MPRIYYQTSVGLQWLCLLVSPHLPCCNTKALEHLPLQRKFLASSIYHVPALDHTLLCLWVVIPQIVTLLSSFKRTCLQKSQGD